MGAVRLAGSSDEMICSLHSTFCVVRRHFGLMRVNCLRAHLHSSVIECGAAGIVNTLTLPDDLCILVLMRWLSELMQTSAVALERHAIWEGARW